MLKWSHSIVSPKYLRNLWTPPVQTSFNKILPVSLKSMLVNKKVL